MPRESLDGRWIFGLERAPDFAVLARQLAFVPLRELLPGFEKHSTWRSALGFRQSDEIGLKSNRQVELGISRDGRHLGRQRDARIDVCVTLSPRPADLEDEMILVQRGEAIAGRRVVEVGKLSDGPYGRPPSKLS